MRPNYLHLFIVMAMIIAGLIAFLLILGDAAPKQKSYMGARSHYHYENDAFKLFLLLFILAGFVILRFSGFNLCEFVNYWAPSFRDAYFAWACS
jgi:uncharacterized membrane protein